MPNCLSGLAFGEADTPKLSDGARARRRPLANSPPEVPRDTLAGQSQRRALLVACALSRRREHYFGSCVAPFEPGLQ